MEEKASYINELLILLSTNVPLTPKFERALTKSLEFQAVKAKKEVPNFSKDNRYAWYSVDCWIAEYRNLQNGKQEVYAIYGPKHIFTDINSFLKNTTSNHKFIVISGTSLLSIARTNFHQLRKFPETPLLLEHYMLKQWELDLWRSELMTYSDREKVNHYAQKYPINLLPNNISASFLRMTPSRFSAARATYNRTN